MSQMQPDQTQPKASEQRIFATVVGGTVAMGVAAIVLGWLIGTPIASQLSPSADVVLVGVIATLPLALFLWWFSNTQNPTLAAFRHSQIKFFSEIGFEFTTPRIIVMAIVAGVAEEFLFRGVLQSWINGFAPVAVALIASNIVFGLLHMRTMLYAVIAGLVGVYLGVVYVYTDSLLAPVITHGLYDYVALIYTKRAIDAYRRDSAPANS